MFVLKLNYTNILCVFTVKSLVKMPIINDTSLKSINDCGNYSLRNAQLHQTDIYLPKTSKQPDSKSYTKK